MIKHTLRTLFALVILLTVANCVKAVNTYDWVGSSTGAQAGRISWANPSNWKIAGVLATTPPGATDIVRIGVVPYTKSEPTLSVSTIVASIEFGNNGGTAMTLTINGATLTVTGTGVGIVKLDHNNATGGIVTTIIDGAAAGALICNEIDLGNTQAPPAPTGTPGTSAIYSTTLNCNIGILTVNGPLKLNSTSATNGSGKTNCNNPLFNLKSGIFTVIDIIESASSFVTGNSEIFNMGTSPTANSLN